MDVPVPATWAEGEFLTYDVMQDRVWKPLEFLLNPPRIKLRRYETMNMGNNSENTIGWNLAEVDNDAMWSAADPSKITPNTPGWYVGTMSFSFGTTTSHPTAGERYVYAALNADVDQMAGFIRIPGPGVANKPLVLADVPLFAYFNGTTDYITMSARQSSGVTLTCSASGNSTFDMRWFAA